MWNSIKIICQIVSVIVLIRLVKYKFEEEIDETVQDSPGVLEDGKDDTMTFQSVAVITRPTNRSILWCGGSVVSKKFILTAAHCLENVLDATIVVNSAQYSVRSNKFVVHPRWQPHILQNDIALVELPQTQDLPDLNPVGVSWGAKIATNQPAVVYGWQNRKPQPIWDKYDVVVISNRECAEYYGVLVTKTNVCVERSGSRNICHGFSGGGLVIDGLLAGMVSFGADKCDLGYPTVHTRLSRYRKWMEEILDP